LVLVWLVLVWLVLVLILLVLMRFMELELRLTYALEGAIDCLMWAMHFTQ
jgi:hypothetical protein